MKLFGRILGGFMTLWGMLFEVVGWVHAFDTVRTIPQPPNISEIQNIEVFIIVSSLLMAALGVYVFMKS